MTPEQEAMAQAQRNAAMNSGLGNSPLLGQARVQPPTPMEEHAASQSTVISHLERAALQLSNMLDNVRGPCPVNLPETESNPYTDPSSLLDRLKASDNRINELCNEINSQLDELRTLI